MPPRKPNDPEAKAPNRPAPTGTRARSVARVRRPRRQPARERAAPRLPSKEPRQERSRKTVEAILQAAAEVFAGLGYARATTNKIAERAGVSVGSLYQYFPNKDSLLAKLLEQHHADVHRVVSAALAKLGDPETPLEEGLRRLLTELVGIHQDNPALTRALSAAVLRESPAAEEVYKEDHAQLSSVMKVLESRPDVRSGDRAAMAMVLGQATAHLTRWLVHDAPPALAPAALEEMVQLLVRFLSTSRGPVQAEG